MTPTLPTPADTSPEALAAVLEAAWRAGTVTPSARLPITDEAAAYAVQEALARRLGADAGWKVGAAGDAAAPNAAPLPPPHADGAALAVPACSLRGIELEVALRLRADLLPGERLLSREELAAAVGEVLPAIELVDSRLAEGRSAPAMVKLADLQSHGALVLGAPAAVDPLSLDLTALRTRLWFGEEVVADATGGHPAPDIWRLLGWLACHAQARGRPLRAGQVVTTGSCTGLLLAPAGTRVSGEVAGLGRVSLAL